MHLLRQLVFRLRPKQPYSLTLDVIEQQVDREVAAVSRATDQARGISSHCHRLRQRLATALHDTRSPGIVDAEEARDLARDLIDASADAHAHQKDLEALLP